MENISFGKFGGMMQIEPGQMERMRADTINKMQGNLDIQDGYNCTLCLNRGYSMEVREKDGNYYMVSVPCKCDPVRKNIMRMKRSGLENLIKKCRFENFEEKEDWQKALKWEAMSYAEEPEGWFYIGGNSGSGKTHLCTAICRKLLLEGHDVLYMLWRDDVIRLKGMLNTDAYQEEINRYKSVEVLYIDDLFKIGRASADTPQKPSQGDINIAFELINFRINNNLKTIISSECTLDELLDIDEAVAGRIADGNHVFSIGKDRRKNYRFRNLKEF